MSADAGKEYLVVTPVRFGGVRQDVGNTITLDEDEAAYFLKYDAIEIVAPKTTNLTVVPEIGLTDGTTIPEGDSPVDIVSGGVQMKSDHGEQVNLTNGKNTDAETQNDSEGTDLTPEKVASTISELDIEDKGLWTKSGMPKTKALENLLDNKEVSSEMRDAAWALHQGNKK